MAEKTGGYVNVDELQARTSLPEAAALCGVSLDAKGTSREVRIDCPFHCSGEHAGRKELSINTGNPQKVFQCHSYQCQFRGNLLVLMHGWLTGTRPSGDKLKGEEFRRVRDLLAGRALPPTPPKQSPPVAAETPPPVEVKKNVPLIRSYDERVRELHDIDAKFITDVAAMNPAAARYVRAHPCLSSESMKKWRCGYLPNDGGGDKRGWSLRGSLVYPVLSEEGHVLAWVGRDVNYEEKELAWSRLSPAEREGKEPPAKHRFPKGFHRGLELFGQQASRLKEPGYREFIAKHGMIVVEGFNDVIGLDNLGIPAVGIMSNRITEGQVDKIARWSRQIAGGKVILMFDCDEPGDEGAKEALWLLAQRKLDVRLFRTLSMCGTRDYPPEPEKMSIAHLETALSG